MKSSDKKKFDLEALKKEQIFRVPEGYFQDLPQIIQARVQHNRKARPVWMPGKLAVLQYAVPALMLILVAIILIPKFSEPEAPAEIIAQVDDEAIMYYLQNEVDLTAEEIIETLSVQDFANEFDVMDGMEDLNIDDEILDQYGLGEDLMF